MQEGHNLCAGADTVGVEGRGGIAAGDVILCCPQNSLIIICALAHISEGIGGGLGLGGACCAPEEGHGLCAGAGAVGIEGAGGIATGHTLFYCPFHSVHIVSILSEIRELGCTQFSCGEGVKCRNLQDGNGDLFFTLVLRACGSDHIVAVVHAEGAFLRIKVIVKEVPCHTAVNSCWLAHQCREGAEGLCGRDDPSACRNNDSLFALLPFALHEGLIVTFIQAASLAVNHSTAGGVGLNAKVQMILSRNGHILLQLNHFHAVELHQIDELLAVCVDQIVSAHDFHIGGNEGAPVLDLIVHRLAVLNGIGIALFVIQAGTDDLAVFVGLIGEDSQLILALKLHGNHLRVQRNDINLGINAFHRACCAALLCSINHRPDFFLVLGNSLQCAVDALILGVNTDREFIIGVNLQQQSQTVTQTCIVGGVASVVLEGAPAVLHDAAVVVTEVTVRHCHLALGCEVGTLAQCAGAEHITVVSQQLRIGAGVQTPVIGDGMTHIGTVGCVCVNEQDGIPVIHDLNEEAGASRLQLGHIAVDVEAVSFGTGTDQLGSKLGGNTILAEVVIAIRAVVGANHDDQILQQFIMLALRHFTGENQHGLLALDLAGVDIAVDIDNRLGRIHFGGACGSLIGDDHVGNGRTKFRLEFIGTENDAAITLCSNDRQEVDHFLRGSGTFPVACLSRRLEGVQINSCTGSHSKAQQHTHKDQRKCESFDCSFHTNLLIRVTYMVDTYRYCFCVRFRKIKNSHGSPPCFVLFLSCCLYS